MHQLDSLGSNGSLAGRKRLGAPPLAFFQKSTSMGSLAEFDKTADVNVVPLHQSNLSISEAGHSPNGVRDSQASREQVREKHSRNESHVDKVVSEQESKFKFKFEDIHVLQTLGSGSGGSVAKCIHKPSNMIMARKVSHPLMTTKLQDRQLTCIPC